MSDEPPILFLTNSSYINKILNKRRRWVGDKEVEYVPNFRELVAGDDRPYKSGRKEEKPLHYYNIINYLLSAYDTVVNEDGLEADDMLCIYQTSAPPKSTIICSRDKDLRQCPGYHYSWECGKQLAIGPYYTDEFGYIELQRKRNSDGKPLPPKIFGYGDKYLYSQILSGDSVDNIAGLPRFGSVNSFNHLNDKSSSIECYDVVKEVYQKKFEDNWETKLRQSADLVYLIRSFDNEGKMVRWTSPILSF